MKSAALSGMIVQEVWVNMQLRMLGTGNAFAKKYYNNNALITSNDYRLMIDCGVTATTSLHELEVPMGDIDGIVITHLHADHVGGLEEVAFQNKYIWNKKNRLYVPEDLIEPLWENCLKAGMDEPLRPTRLEHFLPRCTDAGRQSCRHRPGSDR